MKEVNAVVGKMASGKNYICSQFEKEGWHSIDADLLVHKAIEEAKDTILQTFSPYARKAGISITKQDGTIDRRNLGVILFANPELMAKQEAIVYPVITKMLEDFIEKNDKVIINATVLYKTPALLEKCQKIYYIKAGFFTRLFRAKKRDSLPLRQILKRFYSQRKLFSEYKKTGLPIEIIKN